MNRCVPLLSISALLITGSAFSQPKQTPTPAQSVARTFAYVNGKILEMAKDWPADKYDYQPGKGLRTFGEVIVHVTSGNVYAAKAGRGENVNWDELDPKNYKTKAEVVAALQKSIDDANATLKATPDDRFTKTLAPWLPVIQHASEHYGQLVVYYRNNGLVPPESRPKKK
ncbi:MAG TPA: DinB family protein [Bryobacteraceae bacterium]|nr:DinB family protein [Bryobacteraceae bacterium]